MMDVLKFPITADNRTKSSFAQLRADLGLVKGTLRGVNDFAKRTGRSMRNIGLGMSAGITAPLALIGRQSMQMFDQQAKAQAGVRAAVLSTGGAAGKSADELFRMASGLQRVTTYGDEEILKGVTTPLLTFTKVAGPALERAQMAVLDISTAMGTDMRSNAVQVGKALNDPIKGLSGLSRAGIQFSDDQKEVIKSLVATGDVAAAQSLILDELESQFGGQATAAARVGLGPMQQLGNAIGDVKEQLGEQIVGFLPELLVSVQKGVDWFARLSPEVKKNIVLFGGLAAVGGPILALLGAAAIGVSALSTALVSMGALLLANPIIALIAAVAGGAYLIYRNWEGISGWFAGLWSNVKSGASAGWQLIKSVLQNYTVAGLIYSNWDGIADWFQNMWAEVQTGVSVAWSGIKGLLAASYSPTAMVYNLWSGFGSWFADLAPELTQAFKDLWDAIRIEVGSWPGRMVQAGKDTVQGLIDGVLGRVSDVEKVGVTAGRNLTRGARRELKTQSPSKVFKAIGKDVVDGLALGMRDNQQTALDEMKGITDGLVDAGLKAENIDRQFGTTFSGIVRGAGSARDAIGRLADSLADKALSGLFENVASQVGLGSFISSIFGGLFANGSAFSGGRVVPFASGGVVSSPTTFGMSGGRTGLMGESGPEAIMPLTRGAGGKLGVQAVGGGGVQQVELIVHAADGVAIETVRSEIKVAIRNSAPGIVRNSVAAVRESTESTKNGAVQF